MTDDRLSPLPQLARLRAICLGLPDAVEQPAWTGTRWCVRAKNFAHLVAIDNGWPPAYAKAAQCNGPVGVLTFRLAGSDLAAPRFAKPPFFRPIWFPNIAGLRLDEPVDWDEVERLLVRSYCVLAPKKLVALLDRADS